ncbi:MAG: hypothetical protein KDD42_04660, partial [Bdellovibrionales bacterium]|nr:hypothetical protein [Bdellovibrionales bacterium]
MKKLGHRGVILKSASPYQNSIAAMQLALKHGDGFETDLCLSADQEVFFIHDSKYLGGEVKYCIEEHLDSKSQEIVKGRRIDQLSSEEVRGLRLRDGSSIPDFDEVLGLFKNNRKILNLELKSHQAERVVAKRIAAAVKNGALLAEQLIISSFNHSALEFIRSELPEVRVGMLFLPAEFAPAPIYPWSEESVEYQPISGNYLESEITK